MIAAVLVALGTWFLMPPGSRRRLPLEAESRRLPLPAIAAGAVGLGVATFIGGFVGVALGAGAAALALWIVPRLNNTDEKPRLQALARQAPDAAECLASCLSAGAPLWSAMATVADAFGDPLGTLLRRCRDRHELGSQPSETFGELISEPILAPIGRVLLRSSESGGALSNSLVACGSRMRKERAGQLQQKAQAVGVKSVMPLSVCFLPAFILVSVVPVIGSLVTRFF